MNLLFFREAEARTATLQDEKLSLDASLREANQRIQQLESNQHGSQ